MKTLTVEVSRPASVTSVFVGSALLPGLSQLIDRGRYSRAVIAADDGAARHWLDTVRAALDVPDADTITLDGGKQIKTVTGVQRLWEFFVERRLDRRSLVLTLGGGATSDVTGFAAATFMRGIAFVNVPTTLLAQVDASIGGKTGINLSGAKNVVGSIAQPAAVIVDTATLTTLPQREIRSGFAEVVKHGLIADRAYFEHVTSRTCTGWSAEELTAIVHRSCEIKRDVVQSDETESGPRKTLNVGHTIGHALEAFALETGLPLTHGEAVSIGMAAETTIAERLGLVSEHDRRYVVARLEGAGLPIRMPAMVQPETLARYLSRDKKNVGGSVRWALPDGIGSATFDVSVPDATVNEALASVNP